MEPIITIDSPRVTEGFYNTLTFTVRLSAPATDAVTVDYQALPQTAGWEDLYSTLSGTVTFGIGETVKTISVRASHESVDEADEAFVLELRDPINATFGNNIHSLSTLGWILDDDGSTANNRAIAVSDPIVNEAANGKVSFIVSLSQPFPSDQTFTYRTYDVSAEAGSDYVQKSGQIKFLAGQTEAIVDVDLINDNLPETAQSFGLAITGTGGVDSAVGVAQILNDDGPLPVLSVESGSHVEGFYNYIEFTIRLSAPASDAVTVGYQATPQTTGWEDLYSTLSGTVTFEAGETVKSVTVRAQHEGNDETDEAFIFELRDPQGATFGGNVESLTTIGWIRDDDGSVVNNRALAVSDLVVNEASGGKAVFTVSLSESFATTQSFAYQTDNGSAKAGSDYVSQTGTITFLAGQTEAVVEVDLINNAAPEATESFDLLVTGRNGVGSASGTAIILDDDSSVPVLSIEGDSVIEGFYDYINFTIRLSQPATDAITVDYAALPKSASLEDLYSTISGTVTFAAGETVKTLSLRANYDLVDELDESFLLELRNPNGATFGGGNASLMALGWIKDDDGPFVNRTIAISDSTVTEGPNGREAVFAIELSQSHTEAVSLSYRTVDVSARSGSDYAARSGTVTFEPGQTRVLVTVPIGNDLISESPETFQLRITPPYPTAISGQTQTIWGTGTILDGTIVGSSLNETLTGSEQADAINGMGGNDLIRGLAGNDRLSGSSGNDTLDGGAGADTLFGGTGNDIYFIDSLKDRIIEAGGGGSDTVRARFSYQLQADLENLVLTGGGNVKGTGNSQANNLTGNAGNNVLKGLAGNDRLDGLAGNDRLEGGLGNDRLLGGAGSDTLLGDADNDLLKGGADGDILRGQLGNDTLEGWNGHDNLLGDAGSDRLLGGAGNDRLNGGGGADQLIGGAGRDMLYGGADRLRDVFVFRAFSDSRAGGANRDQIFNFSNGRDDIDLSTLDANTRMRGVQDFDFNGTNAAARSVWYVKQGDGVVIRGDHNGDARADFEIFVAGISSLSENDFVF
ncbi:Calx-beta domain-containing protein [Paracoccus sp. SM22M-07]|uniref:Calx-beta domain-containing protein n=1 Tax=Paracoccus sp. SM22M-07 TaxID=1520813 RepID=UPI0009F973F5|nr:Calx-beta domain-containing protein [Paracoccus sp. SM22M-07]